MRLNINLIGLNSLFYSDSIQFHFFESHLLTEAPLSEETLEFDSTV